MTSSSNQHPPFLLPIAAQNIPGFAYGHKQASLSIALKINKGSSAATSEILKELNQQISRTLKLPAPVSIDHDEIDVLNSISYWTQQIQIMSEHPSFGDAHISRSEQNLEHTYLLSVPCYQHSACAAILSLLLNTFNLHFAKITVDADFLEKQFAEKSKELIEQIKAVGLEGFNSMHFLRAAYALNTPTIFLNGYVMQFGYGANARLMDSSFSDKTAIISVQLARDKLACSHLLNMAGLPVAKHFLIQSEQDAIEKAKLLGFPVVIKPSDNDGGRGVSTHLTSEDAVKIAFEKALSFSKNILLEKHIFGKDFRLHVVHGKVQTVLEREPGGVTGDGHLNVYQLIEKQNHERKNATDERRFLHPITIDHEVDRMLSDIGMDKDSIPSAGQFIRVRAASNVASGGIPVIIDKQQVHPDNCLLAERAAEILRLDIAGVDLLIPDIRVSWLISGAAICEVNAQPQMHTSMHKPTLQALLGDKGGRIPCLIYLSNSPSPQVTEQLLKALQTLGNGVGIASQEGAAIDNTLSAKDKGSIFNHTRALLIDPRLKSLLIIINEQDASILQSGWPIDECLCMLIDESSDNPNHEQYLRYAEGISVRHQIKLSNVHHTDLSTDIRKLLTES